MAFDTIAYVGPAKSTVTLPNDGVLVQARKLGTRGGKIARYITIKIGAGLATKLAMHRDRHPMAVQLALLAADPGKAEAPPCRVDDRRLSSAARDHLEPCPCAPRG